MAGYVGPFRVVAAPVPTLQDRLQRLAEAFQLTPKGDLSCERDSPMDRSWWLKGAAEGDYPLPETATAESLFEALDRVDARLARDPKPDEEE